MDKKAEVVFRQRFCFADHCRAVFYLCRCCDRGQRYCSDHCREKSRRLQRRQANRKHQQSPEGRLDHRDRQRSYRQRSRVTDQGSDAMRVSGTIPPPQTEDTEEADENEISMLPPPYCIVCGRNGAYIETFFASG